jgi:hypothetical protein
MRLLREIREPNAWLSEVDQPRECGCHGPPDAWIARIALGAAIEPFQDGCVRAPLSLDDLALVQPAEHLFE